MHSYSVMWNKSIKAKRIKFVVLCKFNYLPNSKFSDEALLLEQQRTFKKLGDKKL